MAGATRGFAYLRAMAGGDGARPEIDLVEVDAFAEAAHAGQTRSNGQPYISHPRAVRAILEEEFPEPVDSVTLAIALLHDVLEDCDVHPTILLERYGREVQEGVTLLSWRLRALDIDRKPDVYWSGIRRGPRAVRLVKAADRLHNMREAFANGRERSREKYLEETPARLLPILREAGEGWFVERLEEAVETLRAGTS
jgi:GTP pyrophosphokinase